MPGKKAKTGETTKTFEERREELTSALNQAQATADRATAQARRIEGAITILNELIAERDGCTEPSPQPES